MRLYLLFIMIRCCAAADAGSMKRRCVEQHGCGCNADKPQGVPARQYGERTPLTNAVQCAGQCWGTDPRHAPVSFPRLSSNSLKRFKFPFICIFTAPSASPMPSLMLRGA